MTFEYRSIYNCCCCFKCFLKYFKGCRVHKKYKSPVFENQKEK